MIFSLKTLYWWELPKHWHFLATWNEERVRFSGSVKSALQRYWWTENSAFKFKNRSSDFGYLQPLTEWAKLYRSLKHAGDPKPAMSNPRPAYGPVEGFVRPGLGFRCS